MQRAKFKLEKKTLEVQTNIPALGHNEKVIKGFT
jgi:hypothetical protein